MSGSAGGTKTVRAWLALFALALAIAALLAWQYRMTLEAAVSAQRDAGRAAQQLVERHLDETLQARAQMIAGSQAFVGYVAQALGGALPGVPVDTQSILDLLDERRVQLGLADAAVLDGQGSRVVATRTFLAGRDLAADPQVQGVLDGQASSMRALWVDGDRLLRVDVRPLAEDASSEGYLVVAMAVDPALARAVSDVSRLQAAAVRIDGGSARVHASSLNGTAERSLAVALRGGGRLPSSLSIANARHDLSSAPLFGSDDARWISLVPVAESRVAALLPLWPSLLIALLLLGGAALLILRWQSQVVRPTHALVELFERARHGDLHLHATPHGAGPLALLADTFNRMLEGLRATTGGASARGRGA